MFRRKRVEPDLELTMEVYRIVQAGDGLNGGDIGFRLRSSGFERKTTKKDPYGTLPLWASLDWLNDRGYIVRKIEPNSFNSYLMTSAYAFWPGT